MDITLISSAFTSIKVAMDIAKTIKETEFSLEKAEIKLKFADLITALADTKIALAGLQDLVQEKEAEISRLKDSLKIKGELVRHKDAYYFIDENSAPKGKPVCSHCWEVEQQVVHLVLGLEPGYRRCPACKNRYYIGSADIL